MAHFVRSYGAAATLDGITLRTSAGAIKTTPTLASGDVKVSKDGGALANITTLPAETPASSGLVRVSLSATEMQAARVVVRFIDAAGAEWADHEIVIETFGDASAQFTKGSGVWVSANSSGVVNANDTTTQRLITGGARAIYCSSAGDNGDGLSWATAKTTFAAANTAATAGDIVIIAAETFDLAAAVTLKTGVKYRGAGTGLTILTSTTLTSGGLLRPPTGRVHLEDLTVLASNSNLQCIATGGTSNNHFDIVARRVDFTSAFDSFYHLYNGTNMSYGLFEDCTFSSDFDIFGVQAPIVATFERCVFRRRSLTTGARGFGLWGSGGTAAKPQLMLVRGCVFDIRANEATLTMNAINFNSDQCLINIVDSVARVSNVHASAGDVLQVSISGLASVVRISGGGWDRKLCQAYYPNTLFFEGDEHPGVLFTAGAAVTSTTVVFNPVSTTPELPDDNTTWVGKTIRIVGANRDAVVTAQAYSVDDDTLTLTFDALDYVPASGLSVVSVLASSGGEGDGGGATAGELATALAGVADFTLISQFSAQSIDLLKGEAIEHDEGTAFTFTKLSTETWPTTLSSVTMFFSPDVHLTSTDSTAPYLPARFSISSLTSSTTTATATCTAAERPTAGDMVYISGASPAQYNGYFTVATTPTSTTFTYTVPSGLTSPATGTIYGQTGIAATVTQATGDSRAFRVELTKAQTVTLSTAESFGYEWKAVANIATHPKALRTGVLNTRG